MWKLKKLCICVSLATYMFGVNFHTEDKRRERKHNIIHTPGCEFRRRFKPEHEQGITTISMLGNASFPIHTNCELNGNYLSNSSQSMNLYESKISVLRSFSMSKHSTHIRVMEKVINCQTPRKK